MKKEYPVCESCDKEIDSWSGNIMVPETHYPDSIPYFYIWCKPCTRELDDYGQGKKYHNLWELAWIKEDYLGLVEELFEEIKEGQDRWTLGTLKKLNELGRKAIKSQNN